MYIYNTHSLYLMFVCSLQICNRGKVHIFKYLSRIEQLGGSEVALVSENHDTACLLNCACVSMLYDNIIN